MNILRSRRLLLPLILVALTTVAGVRAVAPSGTYFEVTKHLEILTSVFKGVHEFYVEEPEPGTLMSAAIKAMLDELDPYTIYYPESRIEDLRFMNTGEYGGIGALVQPIDGRTTVVEVYEGYPAQEAGLQPGDIVLSVDGRSLDGDLDGDEVWRSVDVLTWRAPEPVLKLPAEELRPNWVLETTWTLDAAACDTTPASMGEAP